jgi:CRP/FNR family cyclic AMP-dependent transcriptional regulator
MAHNEIYTKLLTIPWFKEQEPVHVSDISGISHLRAFKTGDVFFREGDRQDFFYIVLDGRVALEIFIPHRGKVRIYTAEQWDVFGWSSVTPAVRTRTASAIGVIDGLVVGIDAQRLVQLCDQDPVLGYRVMTRLSHVITSRLMVTRMQLLDMFAEPPEKENNGE